MNTGKTSWGKDYSPNFFIHSDNDENIFIGCNLVGGNTIIGISNMHYLKQEMLKAGRIGVYVGEKEILNMQRYQSDFAIVMDDYGTQTFLIKDIHENRKFIEMLYSLDENTILNKKLYHSIRTRVENELLRDAARNIDREMGDKLWDICKEYNLIEQDILDRTIEYVVSEIEPKFEETSPKSLDSLELVNRSEIIKAIEKSLPEVLEGINENAFEDFNSSFENKISPHF